MGPRRRGSTLKASVEGHEELQDKLRQILLSSGELQPSEKITVRIEAAHFLRQYILDSSPESRARDAFRHLGGFQVLLDVIQQTLQTLCSAKDSNTHDFASLEELYQTLFTILAAVFLEHDGNQRYFRERKDGWSAIKDCVLEVATPGASKDSIIISKLLARSLGLLLMCAVNDEAVIPLFHSIQLAPQRPHRESQFSIQGDAEPSLLANASNEASELGNFRSSLGLSSRIVSADALCVMYEIWKSLRESHLALRLHEVVPKLLKYLADTSTENLVKLHQSGLLSILLPDALQEDAENGAEKNDLCSLTAKLLDLGVLKLQDAYLLYQKAINFTVASDLLYSSLLSSNSPSFIHFDLSSCGYASAELPSLGQGFPPTSSSNGYTFSMWFNIMKFDSKAHTTLFGAFDSSQTCFVLLYLERDTHNLILQTSITSSRPSVRFKAVSFQAERWYHLAITHKRPRAITSSKASLFVDGEFVEQVKSQYPSLPPTESSTPKNSSDSLTTCRCPVQTFFGTPQDLASRLGKDLVHTQWRLASAQLFSEVLSDDLIAVYFRLGPRYTGNFQDILGSFQTYEASAELNLRNESLHPGKEERSELLTAMRSKAGDLLAESRVVLNICAVSTYGGLDWFEASGKHPLHNLSKPAYRGYSLLIRGGRNPISMNGAVPAIDQGLCHVFGHAVLTGDPPVNKAIFLDNAAWLTGGFTAVSLALLDSSQSTERLLHNLRLVFSAMRFNWRNSEAIERDHGYSIMANILASKLRKLDAEHFSQEVSSSLSNGHSISQPSLKALDTILEFLGYRKDQPEDSIINNPLAFRTLLVDLDMWRHSSPEVQKLYYGQFITFVAQSKYHSFNSKRMTRMRIVKKWLEALRYQQFETLTFEYFIEAFRLLVMTSFTSEIMRSLALFLTYAIYEPEQTPWDQKKKRGDRSGTSTPMRRRTVNSPSPGYSTPVDSRDREVTKLGRQEVAAGILRVYSDLLCAQGDKSNIHRFARTVTNKWLLFLLTDKQATIVELTFKILGRLLVVSGPAYMQKFVEKTGGMTILRHHLQSHWSVPDIWLVCFSVLFGKDLADVGFGAFDLSSLIQTFGYDRKPHVMCPDILPVITTLLSRGLNAVTRGQSEFNADSTTLQEPLVSESNVNSWKRSLAIHTTIAGPAPMSQDPHSTLQNSVSLMQTVSRFLADIHTKSQSFRDLMATSTYIQELLLIMYPMVLNADPSSPEIELQSRDPARQSKNKASFTSSSSTHPYDGPQIVQKLSPEDAHLDRSARPQAPKRKSSYVIVTTTTADLPRLQPLVTPSQSKSPKTTKSALVEEILELVMGVFCDQIFSRKDFPGLGLFLRVPPGSEENRAYFETFILRNALTHIANTIKLEQKLLCEPRVITNLARLASHLSEAIYEGWFINGDDDTFDFLATIIEHLQQPSIASNKSVRLCSGIIEKIRSTLHGIVLLRLSELDENSSLTLLLGFLDKLAYYQMVLVPVSEASETFLTLYIYVLYSRFNSSHESVRNSSANLLRLVLVHKHEQICEILKKVGSPHCEEGIQSFERIMEIDNDTFLTSFIDNKPKIAAVFSPLSDSWTSFVSDQNRYTEATFDGRISKRDERLKIWAAEELRNQDIIQRHGANGIIWRSNIYNSEHVKRQRALQDLQDTKLFHNGRWSRMYSRLLQPTGLLEKPKRLTWRLDDTEGRNRMRMRFIPDTQDDSDDFKPKRHQSGLSTRHRSSMGARSMKNEAPLSERNATVSGSQNGLRGNATPIINEPQSEARSEDSDDEYEMVDDPREEVEEYEDRNRKVMRSLQPNDQVEFVHNSARIVGLEAVEGLLIGGKTYFYLLDSLFQRLDGEIVLVSQAPEDERDPYLQMISGQKKVNRESNHTTRSWETRHWRWDEILSISKRRFLFRDVAVEVFFIDGQSFLLTSKDPDTRDDLCKKLHAKATASSTRTGPAHEDDAWRSEALRSHDDTTHTLGSRFTSVFAQQVANPATKQWVKGEISNFHYLMLINTMAGRTFNDLTQYPVFPWVLADYTSEELDLTNPRTFRDLTKPMGCQTPERQAEFKDRYQSFAEMGDENAAPFHYGTHYSSAMIVTSYLVRLQPFVHSYLLLQGGFFDHADRLFYSVEKAWSSASRDNMSDVRELIPEFFYLPEFLRNMNGYDFGERQAKGEKIDNVLLPPWAKGDPKIFITKHREALESEYVTTHLHSWIDLIFGHKQRGDAALESTNVFHHLSYHGAKDLDTIIDPVERLATIGIIHNFGQTPHQVFPRAHPAHDALKSKPKRLDTTAETLTRLPFPVLESPERIQGLRWSAKHERLIPSGIRRLSLGPTFEKYVEWGYFDGSLRFYSRVNNKPVGLFEHVHTDHISTAVFANSNTLITGGMDSAISIWNIISSSKSVDLQPKQTLFGHRTPISTLAVTGSFSSLLSASADGQVILWDLNRMELVRVLLTGAPVECACINDITGNILLCRGSEVTVLTLNGDHMLQQDIYVEGDDAISSCAFFEGNGNEYLERQLIFTGHKRGVVNIWSIAMRDGVFVLDHVKRMHHMDQAGFNIGATITAILPMSQVVYTGDDDGRVYEWDCIQRQ